MKQLKLNLSKLEGVVLLTREQLKKIMGGDSGGSGGECVRVFSDQNYDSCWYTTGDAEDLCTRVYGNHCLGITHLGNNCTGCTMN